MSREFIANGNELVAHAAFDVGCKLFGGYPITSSIVIALVMRVFFPSVNGAFFQMADEIDGI
mgnify:CR=1 FL=1